MNSNQEITTVDQFGNYERIGPVRLPLRLSNGIISEFQAWYFGFPGGQYAAIVKGSPNLARAPLVRIESICIWAHLFDSQYCDCGWQLEEAKRRIHEEGVGMIIFAFDQHGKGVGLRNHFLVYAEGQKRGFELVVDSYTSLGFQEDYRTNYRDAAEILNHFNMKHIRLLSNNPMRLKLLQEAGIEVERVEHEVPLNDYNTQEMVTKKEKLQHLLTLQGQRLS